MSGSPYSETPESHEPNIEDYEDNRKGGWIALYRSIKQHWIFDNDKWFKWWIIMLLEANHSAHKMAVGYEIVVVDRGQSGNSLRTWAVLFGCSVRTVDNFFKLLQKDAMIQRKTVGKGKHSTTLVTIEKYTDYQPTGKHKVNVNATQGKRKLPTNNNVKNEQEGKEERGAPALNWKQIEDIRRETGYDEDTVKTKAKGILSRYNGRHGANPQNPVSYVIGCLVEDMDKEKKNGAKPKSRKKLN